LQGEKSACALICMCAAVSLDNEEIESIRIFDCMNSKQFVLLAKLY
jgi:hypothetical protein